MSKRKLNKFAFEVLDKSGNLLHLSEYEYDSIVDAESAGTEWCFDNAINIPTIINTSMI